MAATRTRRAYDHRLRELVRRTGEITIATRVGVPHSTASGWLLSTRRRVVTLQDAERVEADLRAEVAGLRSRLRRLSAVLRVLVALVRALPPLRARPGPPSRDRAHSQAHEVRLR